MDNTALERIRAANKRRIFDPGMAGAGQVFLSFFSPETYKRNAADALICVRRNRAVLIRQSAPTAAIRRADAYWLDCAAHCRREAMRLLKAKP